CSGLEGISPTQAGKAGKVVVVRVKLGPVLDGKSGEMRVGGERASDARGSEQLVEDLQVARTGVEDPHMATAEPLTNPFHGRSGPQRIGQDRGVCGETDEAHRHGPR